MSNRVGRQPNRTELCEDMHKGTNNDNKQHSFTVNVLVTCHDEKARKVEPSTLKAIAETISRNDYEVQISPNQVGATWNPSMGIRFKPDKTFPWLWIVVAIWGMSVATWFTRSYSVDGYWLLEKAIRMCAEALRGNVALQDADFVDIV